MQAKSGKEKKSEKETANPTSVPAAGGSFQDQLPPIKEDGSVGNKKKRTIIIIVLAVLAVVVAFAIYRVYSADNAPVTVKTQKLTKGELNV